VNAVAELYGASSCQITAELREQLVWDRQEFVEYDVDTDADALARLLALTGGDRTIPVLVERGRVTQVGWHGRGCIAGAPR
jgi:glutaredoxin 3